MTDPQNDKPCRDCKRPTQHDTEVCDDCRTPAGRLVTTLASLGVKAHLQRPNLVMIEGSTIACVPSSDDGEVWEITDVAETLDEAIEAQANAIAAIVKAANPDPFDAFRRHLQGEAIRKHGDLLNEHANLQTQTEVKRLREELEKPVVGAWRQGNGGWIRVFTDGPDAGRVAASVSDDPDCPGWWTHPNRGPETGDAGRHAADLALTAAGYRLVGGVHPLPDEVRS